jgi:hypothetical protein
MIRKFFQSALCLCLSPLLAAQQVAPAVQTSANANKPVVLKKGTPVELLLLDSVSSAGAVRGQSVRMVAGCGVTTFDGVVLIPKGTPAVGVVKWVRRAEPGKKDGEVSIKPTNLNLPNSAVIALRNYRFPEEDGLGTALLPLLPFAYAVEFVTMPFHKKHHEAGKEEVIEACTEQDAELTATIVIQSPGTAGGQPTPQNIVSDPLCPNAKLNCNP